MNTQARQAALFSAVLTVVIVYLTVVVVALPGCRPTEWITTAKPEMKIPPEPRKNWGPVPPEYLDTETWPEWAQPPLVSVKWGGEVTRRGHEQYLSRRCVSAGDGALRIEAGDYYLRTTEKPIIIQSWNPGRSYPCTVPLRWHHWPGKDCTDEVRTCDSCGRTACGRWGFH